MIGVQDNNQNTAQTMREYDMDFHERLGARAREARELAGFTVTGAAAKIGISTSYLSRIETAENKPPILVHVQQIAQLYDISVDYLFGLTDAPGRAESPRGVSWLVDAYLQMGETSRHMVRDWIEVALLLDALHAEDTEQEQFTRRFRDMMNRYRAASIPEERLRELMDGVTNNDDS